MSLFTPQDLERAEESGELDFNANILDLRPDPVHFTALLKSLDRPEIASEIFVRVLSAYQESKDTDNADPLRYGPSIAIWGMHLKSFAGRYCTYSL